MTGELHPVSAVESTESCNALIVLCPIDKFPRNFQAKVSVQPNGCWLWIGSASGHPKYPGHDYGQYFTGFRSGRRHFDKAHRFAWQFVHGPIPKHLEIDHLCGCKLCVNPRHLQLLTHQQNCAKRTHSGPLPGFKMEMVNGKRRKAARHA